MKTSLLIIFGMIGLASMFAISPVYASFADSILIHVSGDFRNLYYNEKNVASVFFDPISDSVIFETGSNAELEIKAPKIYKIGPNLFILENGEEIAPETTTDDCFYYVTIQTKIPEKIEVAYTIWPEYPETIEECETITVSPLKQIKYGIDPWNVKCNEGLVLLQKYDGSPACVTEQTKQKLIERGWAENNSSKISESNESSDVGLQIHVTGQQQVRRGTTHDITVDVTRNGNPVSDSLVIITIEDYGKDIIREFKGKTDDSGRFVFSWEIPKSFDDIETLLAYVDVTDDISAKTVLFKFQVYCLPGESGCKVEGN